MCSRHCIGTFWDKIIITFYEVVANYSVPETWSKHRHLKTQTFKNLYFASCFSLPTIVSRSQKLVRKTNPMFTKMKGEDVLNWLDLHIFWNELFCEVSQNCVDRYVSTELCWWSPGETDAGMQRCDVIIGGTHTIPGPRAEGEAWVIQSIKTHSALQSPAVSPPSAEQH